MDSRSLRHLFIYFNSRCTHTLLVLFSLSSCKLLILVLAPIPNPLFLTLVSWSFLFLTFLLITVAFGPFYLELHPRCAFVLVFLVCFIIFSSPPPRFFLLLDTAHLSDSFLPFFIYTLLAVTVSSRPAPASSLLFLPCQYTYALAFLLCAYRPSCGKSELVSSTNPRRPMYNIPLARASS